MKSTAQLTIVCRILSRTLLLLLFPLFSYSQTFFGVSSNPADNGAKAGPTTGVTPPVSMVANDLAIIYAEYRGTGVTLSITTTGGQIWNTATTSNGSNQTFTIFWCTFNGTWGANPVVTVSGGGTNALSAIMYVFNPSNSNSSWGVNVNAVNGSTAGTNPNTIASVTTTAPNTVTMAFWSSAFANTWGTLAGAGWSKTGLTAQYRNTTGTDQSHTGAYNIKTTAGAVGNVAQNETGTTTPALTSIMSWYERGNDDCTAAIPLTSSTTCVNTAGTVVNATYTATLTDCSGSTPTYDVWYSFVAQTTNPVITLSSPGTNFNTPRLQLFSGSCGAFTSVACSTSPGLTINAAGLTKGNTYYIRVYSLNGAVPTSNGTFNICVTDPTPVNDACSGAISLTSAPTCTNTAGTLYAATGTTGINTFCTGTATSPDVWYSFVAQTASPTITLSSMGSNMDNTPRLQIFNTNSCTVATLNANSNNCISGTAVSTLALTPATSLTVGNTYLVRVFSNTAMTNTGSTWNFNICIDDPAPANDLCSAAVTLTPALSCNNTAGNFYASTVSGSPTIIGSCAGAVVNDVWYTFVATTTYATITMSSIGSSITNPGLQLLSGDCTNMYSLACGTSSLLASGLSPGNTYYIRAYSTGSAPTTSINAGFNLCITYPAPPPPPNDNCSGAINLPVNGSCNDIAGTVNSATPSASIPTSCTGPAAYDVWYKFTATTNTTTTITTSNFGAGFSGTRRIELYSGVCGSLTSMSCGTTSIAQTLTPGTTYYVRVYTTTGPAPAINGDFNICVSTTSPPPRIGNSYVNLTKNTVGGVVQNGDILEIRMTILVSSGTIYKTRYLDNIPTKTTMLATTSDSIRVITNEGLTYRRYTPLNNTNDDAGTYVSAPTAGAYNIRLNLGQGSGNMPTAPANNTATDITGAGNLPNTGNPRGGGGIMFATSFRVRVTGAVGDTITLNGGRFIYRTSAASVTDITLTGSPYQILITNPLTLCSNSVGINNASEFGGTFGSGTNLNRSVDLSFPIAGYSFVAASSGQAIGDGQYAIVNNSSPISGTNQNAYRAPNCITPAAPNLLCDNRMFNGYWYIKGDHSGTTNAIGNVPAASGATGGYMLAVNADYVASEAYRQTLTGLCPNTYYEFSAWLQNICPTCGIDSVGNQFAGTVTAPANGYPGVKPNLTFQLDGLDRYSSGQIDTVGWVKKGFVFLTGPSQTTATLSIRNNSQGGGGNDWVMDDISIATCFPSMSYSPTATPTVCKGNTITIGDTVRSQFSNYTYYVWQRSQDNGATWANITTTQTVSPAFNGSQWQYITSYNVPTSATNPSDSGDIYRVYTATTASNITNPNCVANDGSAPISLSVLDCGIVLKTDLLSFNGTLISDRAMLSWSTSREDEPIRFDIEKSHDGISFTKIGSVNGRNNRIYETNTYSFIDPNPVTAKEWYRVILTNTADNRKYSRIISLSKNQLEFKLENVVNPFNSELTFNVIISHGGKISVDLIDMQGKNVKSFSHLAYTGTNSIQLDNTELLPPGVYTLRVQNNDKVIVRKVMKKNN